MKYGYCFIVFWYAFIHQANSQVGNNEINYLFECVVKNSDFSHNDFTYLRTIEARHVNMLNYEHRYHGIKVNVPNLTITVDKLGRHIDFSIPEEKIKDLPSVVYTNTENNIREIISNKKEVDIYVVNKIINKVRGIWTLGWLVKYYEAEKGLIITSFVDDINGNMFQISAIKALEVEESTSNIKESREASNQLRNILMCTGDETVPFAFSNPFNNGLNGSNENLPTSINHIAGPATCWIGDWTVENGTYTINETITYYEPFGAFIGRISTNADLSLDANYNKLYPYTTLNTFFDSYPDLIPGAPVQCTLGSVFGGSGWVGGKILFTDHNWATDLFSVVFAGITPHFSTGTDDLVLGTKDFIAQMYKWESGFTSHDCFSDPDIIAITQRTTEFTGCYNVANNSNNNGQVWSSLLMKIYTNHITDMGDCVDIADMVYAANSDNQISAAEELYKVIKNGGYVSQSDLCSIRATIAGHYSCVGVLNPQPNLNDTDYFIRDSDVDSGQEPYWFGQMWTSPDIWNRVLDDNETAHKDPEYNNGAPNYIKVKISNRGCASGPDLKDKNITLYYSMASTGLTWPEDWQLNLPYSNVIGTKPIDDINSPMTFKWYPPNPNSIPIGDKHHVCIYARITNANDEVILTNETILDETQHIAFLTNSANNIAWKNMSLVYKSGLVGDGGGATLVHVHNPIPDGDPNPPTNPDNSDPFDIICVINFPPSDPLDPTIGIIDMSNPFNDPYFGSGEGTECDPVRPIKPYLSDQDFFKKGEVWLNYKQENSENWTGFNVVGTGYEIGRDGWIKITSENFKLPALNLIRGQHYVLGMKYIPSVNFAPSSFALVQTWPNGKVVGGETYSVYGNPSASKSENAKNEVVALRKTEENILVVMPNPVKNIMDIHLGGKSGINSLSIFDIAGKKIMEMSGQGSKQLQLNIENFENGVYHIKVIDMEDKVMTKKIVKN